MDENPYKAPQEQGAIRRPNDALSAYLRTICRIVLWGFFWLAMVTFLGTIAILLFLMLTEREEVGSRIRVPNATIRAVNLDTTNI